MLGIYSDWKKCKKTIVSSNSIDLKLIDYNIWEILLEEVY